MLRRENRDNRTRPLVEPLQSDAPYRLMTRPLSRQSANLHGSASHTTGMHGGTRLEAIIMHAGASHGDDRGEKWQYFSPRIKRV